MGLRAITQDHIGAVLALKVDCGQARLLLFGGDIIALVNVGEDV